jgi:signal transduction histidine kinase
LDIITSFDLNSQRNIEFEKSDIGEFEELNNTLKKLIEKNVSVLKQQKEFSENASHELQTPLAVIKSRIDLLLQNNTLSKEQSEMIAALNIPLSRVSRINKNLLLLSKIENQQFAAIEPVGVSEVVNDTLEFLSDAIEDKNITVEKDMKGNLQTSVNKSLLEILITNLLVNAFRHNEQNGKLIIKISAGEIQISNSGKTALNTDTLFQRFISSDRATRSSGLGLAIVKQICSHYNWNISYSFHNGLHIFSVSF